MVTQDRSIHYSLVLISNVEIRLLSSKGWLFTKQSRKNAGLAIACGEKKRLNWKKNTSEPRRQKIHSLNLFLLMIAAGSPESPDLPHNVPFSGERSTVAAVEIKHKSVVPSHPQCCSFKQLDIFTGQLEWANFHPKERILLLQITAIKCWTALLLTQFEGIARWIKNVTEKI